MSTFRNKFSQNVQEICWGNLADFSKFWRVRWSWHPSLFFLFSSSFFPSFSFLPESLKFSFRICKILIQNHELLTKFEKNVEKRLLIGSPDHQKRIAPINTIQVIEEPTTVYGIPKNDENLLTCRELLDRAIQAELQKTKEYISPFILTQEGVEIR